MRELVVMWVGVCGALLAIPSSVWASPDRSGSCTAHLQRLGYTRVDLEAVAAHSSLYEARRGRDEVKLMVNNGSCAVERVWLDD